MLDYLDDIESDMSAFHRVDNIWEMEGPRFFRMAFRLTAYSGVMAARAQAENDKPSSGSVGSTPTERRVAQKNMKSQVDNVQVANTVGNDAVFDID